MAIINLTYGTVDAIVAQVYNTFEQERIQLLGNSIDVPKGVGDEVMSWLLPRADNKKILEAMPKWCGPNKKKYMYLKVNKQLDGEHNYDSHHVKIVKLPLDEEWYDIRSCYKDIGIPGVAHSVLCDNILYLHMKDASSLPSGQASDLVKKLFDEAEQHQKITEKRERAVSTMREFLGQHRTLQTALKECPAIMSYVPDWLKGELNRVPPKRTRRPPIPKGERKEIDMSELVTQATIAKLNL